MSGESWFPVSRRIRISPLFFFLPVEVTEPIPIDPPGAIGAEPGTVNLVNTDGSTLWIRGTPCTRALYAVESPDPTESPNPCLPV